MFRSRCDADGDVAWLRAVRDGYPDLRDESERRQRRRNVQGSDPRRVPIRIFDGQLQPWVLDETGNSLVWTSNCTLVRQ